jgi:hypothetical protein
MQNERTVAEVEALARHADVDLRTAMRFLAGMPVRDRSKARLERALRELHCEQRSDGPPPRAA